MEPLDYARTQQGAARAATPEELEAARNLLHYYGSQHGYPGGSFTQALIRAMECADRWNLERLLDAFGHYRVPVNLLRWHGAEALAEWVNSDGS